MTVLSQEQEVVGLEQWGHRPESGGARWTEKSAHPQCEIWCSRVPHAIFNKISLFTNACAVSFLLGECECGIQL